MYVLYSYSNITGNFTSFGMMLELSFHLMNELGNVNVNQIFLDRSLSSEADIEVVCFEKRATTGGLWNYEESADTELPYIAPSYKNLR